MMNRNTKAKMIVFLVIFALLVALVVYAIAGTKSSREYYSTAGSLLPTLPPKETETPAVVETLQPQIVSPPVETVYIVETPEPTIEIVQTPEPTAEPQPFGMKLAEGSFSSDTQYKLNIRLGYKAYVADDSHVTVDMSVYALHYTFHYNSYPNLILKCGEQSQTVDSATINTDDGGYQETLLGSASFSVNLGTGQSVQLPVSADWRYNGQYGKDAAGNYMNIDVLSCGGYVTLAR